jgi:hypothetical protein
MKKGDDSDTQTGNVGNGKRVGWPIKVGYCLASLYFSSYLLLTLQGGYSKKLIVSGKHRYGFGLGIPDTMVWEARWVKLSPHGINALGYAYALPIYLDRWLWHRPITMPVSIGNQLLGVDEGANSFAPTNATPPTIRR